MSDKSPENFENAEEELKYWKELAHTRLLEKQELQREFNDYTDESQQLEKELEMSLDQLEKANAELKSEKIKLQQDIDMLKNRLDQSSRDVSSLQSEVSNLKNDLNKNALYIRELEQKNDDLERAQRVISESIADAQSTLNSAIERNAILESEIDEKEQLKMKLQRLMDETRDLKQELNVRERSTLPDNERVLTNGHPTMDSNRLLSELESNTRSKSPTKRDPNLNSFPMTPSARHSALNLVSDILRKMGTLEAKVAACRNRDYSHNLENRYRRLNRNGPPSNTNHSASQNNSILH